MAREKVTDTSADADADKTAESDTAENPTPGDIPGKKATGDKAAGQKTAGQKASKKAGKKAAEQSATGRRAAEARNVMQRQHRRIGFAQAAATGVELAGAAGMVVAAVLLAWEWDEPLLGRSDSTAVVAQVTMAIILVALAAAWVWRSRDQVGTAMRTIAIGAAVVVASTSVVSVWQAVPGARGAGGVVAAVAAVLVAAGAVGSILAARRLRRLFAFGVRYARNRGYGNLPAVRRAQLIGAPAGAVVAAAAVTGALLVAPGLVTTEDSSTASPLTLADGLPAVAGGVAWDIELAASVEPAPTIWATPGGLIVDEVQGIQVIDPRDGQQRWHWRDDAYRRIATVVVADGAVVVLAMRYDGDQTGRDRVVALDTATGELQWHRFDDQLAAAMEAIAGRAPESDWFAVPDTIAEPEVDPQVDPELAQTGGESLHGVRLVGGDDGMTRWRDPGTDGCRLASLGTDSPEVLALVEYCTADDIGPGVDVCQVTGLSVADGSRLWSWPTPERVDPQTHFASGCRAYLLGGQLFLSYELNEREPDPEADPEAEPTEPPALALDPATGAEVWAVEREEDSYASVGVDGLADPRAVIGDRVVGMEWTAGQPGLGPAALILRDIADGSRLGEVELPEGQPVGFRDGADDDTLLITMFRAAEVQMILLLEVDLAAQAVVGETVVATTTGEDIFGSAGLAVGPQTVAVDTLVGTSPEDIRLRVQGFG